MYDNLNAPHCTCHYQYAWHYEGPKRAMETWDSVLSEYAADCTIGQHAALAALLTPKPDPSGWHATMRARANADREAAGLPREDEDPYAADTDRLRTRLLDYRRSPASREWDIQEIDIILDRLASPTQSTRELARNHARDFLFTRGAQA